MRKTMKSITSLVIALTMIASCMFVMPVSADALDPADLLLEDFQVGNVSGSNTTIEAKPWPFFLGDFYPSGGAITAYRFSASGYYDRYISSEYQRWWINDTDYDSSAKGRAITYRPKAAGEYYVNRDDTDFDAYIPYYVGNVSGGDYAGSTVPEDWIFDNWGFNGFRYSNGVLTNNQRDMSAYVDTGYIVYTINIPSDMNTEGVYLAISTSSGSWNDGNTTIPWGQIAVGVPLTEYYDTTVGGWQTVMVPMSAFDFTVNGGENDVFVNAHHGDEGVWQNNYEAYRKWNSVQWGSFTGIGIVRNDLNDSVAEEFYLDVKNLAVINDVTAAPTLTAEFDTDAVNLSWTDSGYTGTEYVITKTSSEGTETIDVSDATTYVDEDVANGTYTYKVTSTVAVPSTVVEGSIGTYDLAKDSASATVEVTGIEPDDGKVSIVKEDIDFENWAKPTTTYESFLTGTTYYIDDGYWCTGSLSKMTLDINDSDATEDKIQASSGTYSSNGKAWGYKGTKYYTGYIGSEGSVITSEYVPAHRWMGVMDISEYKDNGYAVFTIDSVSGDTENAYLAIETATSNWDIDDLVVRMLGSASVNPEDTEAFPITPERYPVRSTDQPFKAFYSSTVSGVALEDYYDVATGGQQTVAIPLSVLANSATADFREVRANDTSDIATDIGYTTDLRLFAGMGIARNDTASGETFQAVISDLKIIALDTPANFSATKNGSDATLTWDETLDRGVTYKVYRNGSCIATTTETSLNDVALEDGEYTYTVAAYDAEYDVTSPMATSVTIEIGEKPEFVISSVDMSSYTPGGYAWDVTINGYDAAKTYSASFTADSDNKTQAINGISSIESSGSVAFAIFLHSSKASVALDIVKE